MKNILFILLVLLTGLLSGCNHEYSRGYLLSHPDILKQAMTRCHSGEANSEAMARQCEMVMSAADEFVRLLSEQESNPEAFGQRIMMAQVACVEAKEKHEETLKHVQALRRVRVGGDELSRALAIETQTHNDYLQKRLVVHVLLAVIGVNSPE